MALSDQVAAFVSDVVLSTDYFGETVTHTPHGLDAVDLVGNCYFPADTNYADDMDSRDGLKRVRNGTIQLPSGTENLTDGKTPSQFTVRGETWVATGIGKEFAGQIIVNVRFVKMSTLRQPRASSYQSQ